MALRFGSALLVLNLNVLACPDCSAELARYENVDDELFLQYYEIDPVDVLQRAFEKTLSECKDEVRVLSLLKKSPNWDADDSLSQTGRHWIFNSTDSGTSE